MATNYTLTDIDGTPIRVFARKDGAIKAAERDSLLAYEVVTDSGKVVHAVDNRPASTTTTTTTTEESTMTAQPVEDTTVEAEAPKPAKKAAAKKAAAPKAAKAKAEPKAKAAPVGTPVAYTDDNGAKRFFPAAAAGAKALAESMGIEVTTSNVDRVVYVPGNKTEVKAFQKRVTALWNAAWADFKGFKAENKETRKVQWATNDGKRAMFADEIAFLSGHMAKSVAEAAEVL